MKVETGDLDLSGFNLLAGNEESSDLGTSLFNDDPEKKGEESENEKSGIIDERTSKDNNDFKIQTKYDLDEDEEEEEEDDDSSEEEKETKTSKKSETKKDLKNKEEENEEDEEDNEEDDDSDNSPFLTFAKFLDENGIADYDEENFEDSEAGLLAMVNKSVEKGVKAYKESIPDEAKKFLEYLEAGGDPKQYVENSQSIPNYRGLSDDMLSKESVQKALVTDWMRLQGYSDEEIGETLEDYEESGILEKQAKRIHPKLVGKQKEYEDNILNTQKEQHQKQIEAHKEYIESIKKSIDNAEDIAGIPITKKAKDEFFKYVTESNKEGKTKLLQDIEADPDAQLKMAWFMYNKFDFSKIETKAKTKVSSKLRDNLSNLDSSLKLKGKSKGSAKKKDSDELDLSSFKRLL